MTGPFDEHAERLRRALHAEADAVMPSPDALDRIRTRIALGQTPRRPPAWTCVPWVRPLAAVAAAAAAAALALAAPPMITNFIANPAGNHQAGRSPAGTATDGRYFPAVPPGAPAPAPSGPLTAYPSAPPSPSTTPSVTTACERPGDDDEVPAPDPSSSPSPSARSAKPCPKDDPQPPPSAEPRPSSSVGPSAPPNESTQGPLPGLPEEQVAEP